MRGHTIAKASAAVLLSCILSACGGGGGGSPFGSGTSSSSSGGATSSSSSSGTSSSSSSSGTTVSVAHIILVPSGTSLSGSSAATVTLTATVTDANNVAVSGVPVTFSADSGVVVVSGGTNGTVDTGADGTATATLSNGGVSTARTITATAAINTLSATATVQVTPAASLKLGTLSGTTFTAGSVAVGQSSLPAGGSTGLQAFLYDTANNVAYNGNATVVFSSTCSNQNLATITSPVVSTNGTFNSTYTAAGCSGSDTITAVATVNGTTVPSATATLTVQPATLGSIQFDQAKTKTSPACVSASSAINCVIGLKGTGQNETAQVYFKVLDANGNPVPNQVVNFSLTSTVGGLALNPSQAKSDANGEVTTTVASGTVHTAVRVTAAIASSNLSSQSSLLTVSTGFPAQNGSSISATQLNFVGNDFDGNTSQITVRLSDRYNNPVPDNTVVAFQSECGQVTDHCSTASGACTVTFTTSGARTAQLSAVGTNVYTDNNCSANPHGLGCDDHRCTVLATAVGEESFNDCNGTGQYVSKDNSSNNPAQCPSGDFFVSLPEAWLDSNENGVFDGDTEVPVDYNENGKYDSASNKFIGLLCTDPDCDVTQSLLDVRQSIVLVLTSSSASAVKVTDASGTVLSPIVVPINGTVTVYVTVEDSAGQVPPVGTTVAASLTNGGSIIAPNPFVMPNTNAFGPAVYPLILKGPAATGTDTLILTTTTSAGSAGGGGLINNTSFAVKYQ